MDDYVKSYLTQWELVELIPKFEDEEVNEKAFKCLSDDIIRELIPKLGKRAIFVSAYKVYREALSKKLAVSLHSKIVSIAVTATVQSDLKPHHLTPVDSIYEHNKVEDSQLNDIKTEPSTNADEAVPDSTLESTAESTPLDQTKSTTKPGPMTFSIAPLLDASEQDLKTAESLLQLINENAPYLTNKSFLTPETRGHLSKEIIRYLNRKNNGEITKDMLKSWARGVEIVFKTEVAALYYREAQDSSFCAGKLHDMYQRLQLLNGQEDLL